MTETSQATDAAHVDADAKNPAAEGAFGAVLENATKLLGLETLEERHSDSLDFHELSVWKIEALLRMAFEAGLEA